MMRTILHDLDELVYTVRSKISKIYIVESINAYKSRALRSGLLSVWIAVSYDIIEKIKELAEGGDNSAIQYVTDLQNAIDNSNIPALQRIEDEILDKAHEQFKFINSQEFVSLNRLKADRNLCAHPAFTNEELLYEPTAELVRTYIVHAIKFLLMHAPVQGKAAIDKIALDLKRESFPSDLENTYNFLCSKYLNRAKDSLIVNLIKALSKTLINREADYIGKEQKLVNSLIVISRTHPDIYKAEVSNYLNRIVDSLEDSEMFNILLLLQANEEGWNWLNEAAKIRLKNVLKAKLIETPDTLEKYKLLEQFKIEAFSDIKESIVHEINDSIFKRIFEYSNVGNYAAAEEKGRSIILPYLKYYEIQHLEKLVDALINNQHDQIFGASGSVDVWIEIFDQTKFLLPESLNEWKKVALKIAGDNYDWKRLAERIEFEISKIK